MDQSPDLLKPYSTADAVYERLFQEIASLDLLPGSKISEAEIGRRFGVSRQPVRDAFKRLGNLELLEIRPQRATVVRRFSLQEIENTRFLRLAVELEVMEQACAIWDGPKAAALEVALAEQHAAWAEADKTRFHQLDYSFHTLICDLAACPMASDTITQCKRKVDRLCVLSLTHDQGGPKVLEDHKAIAQSLSDRSVAKARALIRRHLARLDETICEIHQAHADFFQ